MRRKIKLDLYLSEIGCTEIRSNRVTNRPNRLFQWNFVNISKEEKIIRAKSIMVIAFFIVSICSYTTKLYDQKINQENWKKIHHFIINTFLKTGIGIFRDFHHKSLFFSYKMPNII